MNDEGYKRGRAEKRKSERDEQNEKRMREKTKKG